MPFFEYRAVDGEGTPACGARQGETPDAVRQELAAEGLRASAIWRRDDPGAGGLLRRGVSAEDLAFLHRQTANLLSAGVTLPDALRAVARESSKHELKLLVDAVASDVAKGRTLSEALGAHGKAVPPFVADLLRAGETAGNLPTVLIQVAEGAEAEARLRRQVRTALVYPLTVATFALLIVILNGTGVFSWLFLDKQLVYQEMVRDLETMWGTTIDEGTPLFIDLITHPVLWGMVLVGFIAMAGYGLPFFVIRGSRTRVPVFGKLVECVLVSRFCRVLGMLVGREVPLPVALRLAGRASDSRRLEMQSEIAAQDVEHGQPFRDAVDNLSVLPVSSRWGASTAASRGCLSGELKVMADRAEEASEDLLRRFSILLETALVVVIGLFVLMGAGGSIMRTLLRLISALDAMQGGVF
jgi:type IV pilus assembly protein PilC